MNERDIAAAATAATVAAVINYSSIGAAVAATHHNDPQHTSRMGDNAVAAIVVGRRCGVSPPALDEFSRVMANAKEEKEEWIYLRCIRPSWLDARRLLGGTR